jgi:hypothetical protein
MAGKNTPAGIRSLFYGMSKGKVSIEGLSVSGLIHEIRAGGELLQRKFLAL